MFTRLTRFLRPEMTSRTLNTTQMVKSHFHTGIPSYSSFTKMPENTPPPKTPYHFKSSNFAILSAACLFSAAVLSQVLGSKKNEAEKSALKRKVAVIGAGVNGLSTGLELLKQGYEVTLFTTSTSPNTTSNIAAAIWMPYKVKPEEQAVLWAALSLERFRELEKNAPDAGILFKTHTELHSTAEPKPAWMNYLESLPIPSYVPQAYRAHSHTVKIPVIDTKKYMPYLHNLFLSQGGQVKIKTITKIEDLLEQYNLVINCTGLGAKELAKDDTVYPIRGQVLRIQKPTGFDDSLVRPSALAHLISRSDDCLIGGTADEGNWNLPPDPTVTQEILAGVKEIYPPLANQPITVFQEIVGLRPGRPTVRLEIEKYDDNHAVVHNYGHGGAGIALSWGCASETVKLVNDFYYNYENRTSKTFTPVLKS